MPKWKRKEEEGKEFTNRLPARFLDLAQDPASGRPLDDLMLVVSGKGP